MLRDCRLFLNSFNPQYKGLVYFYLYIINLLIWGYVLLES